MSIHHESIELPSEAAKQMDEHAGPVEGNVSASEQLLDNMVKLTQTIAKRERIACLKAIDSTLAMFPDDAQAAIRSVLHSLVFEITSRSLPDLATAYLWTNDHFEDAMAAEVIYELGSEPEQEDEEIELDEVLAPLPVDSDCAEIESRTVYSRHFPDKEGTRCTVCNMSLIVEKEKSPNGESHQAQQ